MSRKSALCSLATLFGFAVSSQGAISITADPVTPLTVNAGAAAYDTITFPPSGLANPYWDANADGIFGNSPGENTGNTNATIGFTIPIVGGTNYFLGMEGFTVASGPGSVSFTLTNSDASTQALTVNGGVPLAFNDSNGDPWVAEFQFNVGAYGDVVFNGGAGGNGAFQPDHQGILRFTLVPEPGSAALLGLGFLGLALRRKR